jgi:Flp pilus assembly pilin Flp
MVDRAVRIDSSPQHDQLGRLGHAKQRRFSAWHRKTTVDRVSASSSIGSAPGWRAGTALGKEVNNHMTISEWFVFFKENWRKQEGQTMAEYGVVLGVITVLAIGAFTLLSGGIQGAINKVTSILPH